MVLTLTSKSCYPLHLPYICAAFKQAEKVEEKEANKGEDDKEEEDEEEKEIPSNVHVGWLILFDSQLVLQLSVS